MTDSLLINHPEMDADHQAIHQAWCALVEALKKGEQRQSEPVYQETCNMESLLKAFRAECAEHFAWEENLMTEMGYASQGMHQMEHRCFLDEFDRHAANWAEQTQLDQARDYWLRALPLALENHIMTADLVLAQWLQRHGR